MFLVIDLIDLVAKHKSGELRCPATALIGVGISDCSFPDHCLLVLFFLKLQEYQG